MWSELSSELVVVGSGVVAGGVSGDGNGQVLRYWEMPDLSARSGHRSWVYLVSPSMKIFIHASMLRAISPLPPAGNP